MKLTLDHALYDGFLASALGLGVFLKYYFGFLMLLSTTLVFGIVLFGASPDLTNLYKFRMFVFLSPIYFVLGWLIEYYVLKLDWKGLNKRMDFAFKDLKKQMKKNDFWKPLFVKKKVKK